MPFKHNAGFRHKFPKAKYAVKNWAAYNAYLRLRGDVLIWSDPVMLPGWRACGVRKRGGKLIYSDLAIELCLTLRVVFGLPLRQTQGFVRSPLLLQRLFLWFARSETVILSQPDQELLNCDGRYHFVKDISPREAAFRA